MILAVASGARQRSSKQLPGNNGSPWFITGAPDSRWNDENLEQIKRVPGAEFEAVESGPVLRG
jgi:hypothetical protein